MEQRDDDNNSIQKTTSAVSKRSFSPFKEGQENQQQQQQQIISSSPGLAGSKQDQPPSNKKYKIEEMKSIPRPDDDDASDCGTEISVAARRAWLKQFEQKHQANPFRKMQRRDDTREEDRLEQRNVTEAAAKHLPKTPERQTSASTLMNRLVMNTTSPHHRIKVPPRTVHSAQRTSVAASAAIKPPPSFHTPSRRQYQKEQVMATDEGYASVKELSQWLAADPTSTKKKKQVRRGRNVILKSRHFESSNDVVMVENNISKGAVKDRQKWLSNAFHKNDEEDECGSVVSGVASRYYAKSEIAGGYSNYNYNHRQRLPKPPATNSICDAQSEIITDDAASSLSVADKKDWLKNAFAGGKTSTMAAPSPAKKKSYAQSDVMYNRSDVASRAKMRFKERSARKLMSDKSPIKTDIIKVSKEREVTMMNTTTLEEQDDTRPPQVEEDVAPVNFRAAREALVQRSKKNGNKVDIVNKVYLRKKKFEKIGEENRRMSSAQGLSMKASWDLADPSKGLASDSFEKKMVSDIAPKKSFEDLP